MKAITDCPNNSEYDLVVKRCRGVGDWCKDCYKRLEDYEVGK